MRLIYNLKLFFMQKILASFLSLTFLVSISGCSIGIPAQTEEEKKQAEIALKPFISEYEMSEQGLNALAQPTDAELILAGGPLMVETFASDQPGVAEFDRLLKLKIDEVVAKTAELHQKTREVEAGVAQFQAKIFELIDLVLDADKNFAKQAKEITTILLSAKVSLDGVMLKYESIQPSQSEFTKAFLNFEKATLALEESSLLNEDFNTTVRVALNLSVALENSPQKALLGNYDKDFETQYEAIGKNLEQVIAVSYELDHLFKQINTANYYMGLASVAQIEKEITNLKTATQTLTPNSVFGAEEIEFIQLYAEFFEAYAQDIKATLNAEDKNNLIEIPAETALNLTPLAYAEEEGYLKKGWESLKTGADYAGKAAEVTWEAGKWTFKKAKTGVGVTLDTLGAGAKTAGDIWYGAGNKNSAGEIFTEVKGNFTKIADNYTKDLSGADTLKTAEDYMNQLEGLGGDVLEKPLEQVMGKGWVSWGAGHIGKTTVNLFTGFSKGVYKIANKSSSNGDVLEGALEIGLSCIGGSKVIFKGTNLAKGSAGLIKNVSQKSWNTIQKIVTNSEIQELKTISNLILDGAKTKLGPKQVAKLLSNAAEIEANELMQAELKTIGSKLNQEFVQLMSSAGKGLVDNLKSGKTEYINFVKKTFESSLSGYKEALIGVLGENFKDYVDNLVANKANDLMKYVAKEYMDKGIIPGFGGQFDGNYSGSMTKDEITLPIQIGVSNGEITGEIVKTIDFDDGVFSVNAKVDGTVLEDGSLSGKVTGTVKITGGDTNLTATLHLTHQGQVEETQMRTALNGTATISGTFWGQEAKDGPQTIDQLDFVLEKMEE